MNFALMRLYYKPLKRNVMNQTSFVLCYTIRIAKANGKTSEYDYFEIFCEVDENENSPEEQAKIRQQEINSMYENNETSELYCWNIAKLTETSEHYPIVKFADETELYPISEGTKFDAIEMHPVQFVTSNCDKQLVEQCEDDEADFWSVYVHLAEGGLQCIADCKTKEAAQKLADLLEYVGNNFYRNPEND